MIVLVDVDSTVLDLIPEWLRLYNNDYSDNLQPEQITEWAIDKFVHPHCGKKIFSYLLLDNLYDNVKPIDGALDGIKYIQSLGHRVVFVSSGIYATSKYNCLERNGFDVGEWGSNYVVAHDKSLIRGDMLIDDRWENIIDFYTNSKIGSEVILFSQPWNRQYKWEQFRADSWKDIVDLFDKWY